MNNDDEYDEYYKSLPVKCIDWSIVKVLPTDYTDYGGEVERWADETGDYPDCGSSCRWFAPLAGGLGMDWGVCANPNAPRAGLLTWEHQTGRGCFEREEDMDE